MSLQPTVSQKGHAYLVTIGEHKKTNECLLIKKKLNWI